MVGHSLLAFELAYLAYDPQMWEYNFSLLNSAVRDVFEECLSVTR